jgi:hypothetical protein
MISEPTHPRIEAARSGTDPALVCRVPSGWVFLCTMQYLPGYCILQADPVLHTHIVPRFLNEPEELRKGGPWSYPKEIIDARNFDSERDQELIRQLREAILKHLPAIR